MGATEETRAADAIHRGCGGMVQGSLREFATADSPRMLAALRRISALADQWYGERGNDYSASAQYARKLRDVLSEELLGEEGSDA